MKQLKKQRKKRKTKKGFTLVELLAVIVILAIVVGITLVTVLPTLKNARQEAFEISAQTAADYLEKQYQLSLLGSFAGETLQMSEIPTDSENPAEINADDLIKAGLKPENYIYGTWYVDTTTGRACVYLEASTNDAAGSEQTNLSGTLEVGEYYDAEPANISTDACFTGNDEIGKVSGTIETDMSTSVYESSDYDSDYGEGIYWHTNSDNFEQFEEGNTNQELKIKLNRDDNYKVCGRLSDDRYPSYVSVDDKRVHDFECVPGPDASCGYDCYDLGALTKGTNITISSEMFGLCGEVDTTCYYLGGISFYIVDSSGERINIK